MHKYREQTRSHGSRYTEAMRRPAAVLIVLAVALRGLAAFAQPRQAEPTQAAATRVDPQRELLEHLTGHWVLRGVIAKQQTTHDIDAQWVLDKEYLQIHEVSRERDTAGKPKYEAIIHVVWDPTAGEYACLWLDTTGVAMFPPEGVGHAKPERDRIAFVFKDAGGGIHTTFAYDRAQRAWSWTIDNDVKGTLTSFARVKLTRS
jgi:hypothetical protein